MSDKGNVKSIEYIDMVDKNSTYRAENKNTIQIRQALNGINIKNYAYNTESPRCIECGYRPKFDIQCVIDWCKTLNLNVEDTDINNGENYDKINLFISKDIKNPENENQTVKYKVKYLINIFKVNYCEQCHTWVGFYRQNHDDKSKIINLNHKNYNLNSNINISENIFGRKFITSNIFWLATNYDEKELSWLIYQTSDADYRKYMTRCPSLTNNIPYDSISLCSNIKWCYTEAESKQINKWIKEKEVNEEIERIEIYRKHMKKEEERKKKEKEEEKARKRKEKEEEKERKRREEEEEERKRREEEEKERKRKEKEMEEERKRREEEEEKKRAEKEARRNEKNIMNMFRRKKNTGKKQKLVNDPNYMPNYMYD